VAAAALLQANSDGLLQDARGGTVALHHVGGGGLPYSASLFYLWSPTDWRQAGTVASFLPSPQAASGRSSLARSVAAPSPPPRGNQPPREDARGGACFCWSAPFASSRSPVSSTQQLYLRMRVRVLAANGLKATTSEFSVTGLLRSTE
jgi:hypothetical protein